VKEEVSILFVTIRRREREKAAERERDSARRENKGKF
jgi:hypothetical protein